MLRILDECDGDYEAARAKALLVPFLPRTLEEERAKLEQWVAESDKRDAERNGRLQAAREQREAEWDQRQRDRREAKIARRKQRREKRERLDPEPPMS